MEIIIKDDIDMNIFTLSDYFENYDKKYVYQPNKTLINNDINLILIKKFIKKNKDIHQQDEKLFIINCFIGHIEIVKLLIEHGVNIHAQNDYAFIYSCRGGHIEIVKLLIEHGVNIHAQNDYAFIYSCFYGYINIVKLLIEHGANIHAQNDIAFINSCKYGYIDIVKLLIEYVAKREHVNDDDKCLICKSNNEKRIQLNCSHVYHVECLVNCFEKCKKIICPYCQIKIDWTNCYTN